LFLGALGLILEPLEPMAWMWLGGEERGVRYRGICGWNQAMQV